MPAKPKRKPTRPTPRLRSPDVLDVHGTAELLTVSADTVYDLFASGEDLFFRRYVFSVRV